MAESVSKNDNAVLPKQDGIVLLAKKSGLTSFSSLNNVKKALHTGKVGHTGTLDSFAQGLLVVCVGKMTKLVSHITEFDKTYLAVIKFGEETDTLEYTGSVIKTSELPLLEDLKKSLTHFTGELLQSPPAFSAVHVDGKRASDLARKGIEVEIPKRKITVFSTNLKDYQLEESSGRVLYALVEFSVSKGTYIRSLARDIAKDAKSAGHLTGLLRTKVGKFLLSDAAGKDLLNDFTIENAKKEAARFLENQKKNAWKKEFFWGEGAFKKECLKEGYAPSKEDLFLQKEIQDKITGFSEETSLLCGFFNVHLKSESAFLDFKNGKKLSCSLFEEFIRQDGMGIL